MNTTTTNTNEITHTSHTLPFPSFGPINSDLFVCSIIMGRSRNPSRINLHIMRRSGRRIRDRIRQCGAILIICCLFLLSSKADASSSSSSSSSSDGSGFFSRSSSGPTRGRGFNWLNLNANMNKNKNHEIPTENQIKPDAVRLGMMLDNDVKDDEVLEQGENHDDRERDGDGDGEAAAAPNDESMYDSYPISITGTDMVPQIGAGLGALLSSKQLANLTLTGIQFGICFYLAKAIWKAMVEVIDELGSASSGFLQDDYDSPYLNEDVVDSATDTLVREALFKQQQQQLQSEMNIGEEGKDDSEQKFKWGGNSNDDNEKINQYPYGTSNEASRTAAATATEANRPGRTRHSPFVSNLAMRLSASGLPLVSPNTSTKSVQSVLKSLTRSEGKLLSSTLLSPMEEEDGGDGARVNVRNESVMKMWDGIGGLGDAKEGLLDLVFPLMEKQLLSQTSSGQGKDSHKSYLDASYYGGLLQNPPGVLLYGPPGCGKTMLCRALAGTVNARFLCVTPSTLLRKYFGETNINVKSLFTLARKISPCIIFIDEMEGLFRERRTSGSEEHEVNRELKTEFMQHWDGINSNGGDGIIVIGATNRPFDVDSAFLRRMPRSFFIGLPDRDSRIKILSSMLSDVPLDRNFDIEYLADATSEYTPSDMKEVLRTAALFPLREARAKVLENPSELGFMTPELRPLETKDVMEACRRVSPTQLTREYTEALLTFASKASGRNNINNNPPFNNNFSHNAYGMNQNPGGPCFVSDFATIQNPQEAGSFSYQDHSDEYDDDSYSYDDE